MRLVRRQDHSPRIELLPLIDVIFLLLVFFIYSFLVMTYARVLPVRLMPVTAGEAAERGAVMAITIDTNANIYLDQSPVTIAQLRSALLEVANTQPQPQLFLATELSGPASPDRLPVYMKVQQLIQESGLPLNLVGPRTDGNSTDEE